MRPRLIGLGGERPNLRETAVSVGAGMTVFAHWGIFLQPAKRDRSGSPGDPNDPFAILVAVK
jgi:hypothetical protein